MTGEVLAIRHVGFEDLGLLEPLLTDLGYRIHYLEAGIEPIGVDAVMRPELLVVLGGPLTQAGSVLLDAVRDQVWRCCNRHEHGSVRIVFSELGDRAPALGAANLAIRQFLSPTPLPDMRTPLLG